MTDRLTPAMLRDLAAVVDYDRPHVSSPDVTFKPYGELAKALRAEAARREAEGQPGAALDKLANGDEWNTDAPPPPAPDDLVRGLRDRARHARAEGNATATSDAWHFEQAADAIKALRAERDAAEAVVSTSEQLRSQYKAHDDLLAENKRLREALQNLAYYECYTRDGEEPPHVRMMQEARAALAQGGNDDQGK